MSAGEFVAKGKDPVEQYVRQLIVDVYGEENVAGWGALIPLFIELFSMLAEKKEEEESTPESVLACMQSPSPKTRRRAINHLVRDSRREEKRVYRPEARDIVDAAIKKANDDPAETLTAIEYELGA